MTTSDAPSDAPSDNSYMENIPFLITPLSLIYVIALFNIDKLLSYLCLFPPSSLC